MPQLNSYKQFMTSVNRNHHGNECAKAMRGVKDLMLIEEIILGSTLLICHGGF
jgi:hypothetical protein